MTTDMIYLNSAYDTCRTCLNSDMHQARSRSISNTYGALIVVHTTSRPGMIPGIGGRMPYIEAMMETREHVQMYMWN